MALWRVPHVIGVRWKSHHRKIVHLSPYVEKPLNSKVIKSFVHELRSHVFRVSGFLCSMYMLYIWTLWTCYIYEHHVVSLARISLTLSRHFSLSFIASGRSSGLHPVSSHSCCMYVLAGRPAFAWPYARVHRSTSLMSSSLLLKQCPACPVRLAWIVFVMGGRWPYS